jgi:AcrR family transcriptional regulator
MANAAPQAARHRHRRRADRTRTRLLDAAVSVFLEKGYDGASLGEVTKQADLGTGTLYLHFRDKRALYEAVVRRAVVGMWTTWKERYDQEDDDPAVQIRLMIRVAIEFFAADRRRAVLFLQEGPALESFLLDDVSVGIGSVLEGRVAVPRMAANLVIGACLAAGRWWLHAPKGVGTEALIRTTVNFCGGGIAALRTERRTRRRSTT